MFFNDRFRLGIIPQMNQRADTSKSARLSAESRQPAPAKKTGAAQRRQTKFALMPTVSAPAVLDVADGSDRSFRQLLYDISTAASHLESARSYLASCLGVTSPQYNMVMVIAQYQGDEGISVNEIAEHLHVSNTFVTMEVKKLERQGLVVKAPNPVDARSVLIRLSDEGAQQVHALQPELLFVNDHLFEHISAADFQALSRIVASLIGDFSRTVAMLGVLAKRSGEPQVESQARVAREGLSKALQRSGSRPR